MDYYILLFSIVTGIITSILLIVLLSILATSKQKEKVRDLRSTSLMDDLMQLILTHKKLLGVSCCFLVIIIALSVSGGVMVANLIKSSS